MAVMGGIVQRRVEFLPLFAEAFFDAFIQILEQTLALGRAQKAWKGVENHQQRSQFRTRRQRRIRLGHLRQTPLRSLRLVMLKQIRRQHLAVTPRCGQIANCRGRRLQLLDTRQAAQRPQQAAQAPHRSAQIMQRLGISARSQARLTCQQPHIQAQHMSHQAIDHGGLLRRQLQASSCKLQAERGRFELAACSLKLAAAVSVLRGIRGCRSGLFRLSCCSLRSLRIVAGSWRRSAATALWNS